MNYSKKMCLGKVLVILTVYLDRGYCQIDPCLNYTALNDTPKCNAGVTSPMWYRFVASASGLLSTNCELSTQCGTNNHVWMNDTIPTSSQGITKVNVCIRSGNNCCERITRIKMKTCNGFVVYELIPIPPPCSRYCFDESVTILPTASTTMNESPTTEDTGSTSPSTPITTSTPILPTTNTVSTNGYDVSQSTLTDSATVPKISAYTASISYVMSLDGSRSTPAKATQPTTFETTKDGSSSGRSSVSNNQTMISKISTYTASISYAMSSEGSTSASTNAIQPTTFETTSSSGGSVSNSQTTITARVEMSTIIHTKSTTDDLKQFITLSTKNETPIKGTTHISNDTHGREKENNDVMIVFICIGITLVIIVGMGIGLLVIRVGYKVRPKDHSISELYMAGKPDNLIGKPVFVNKHNWIPPPETDGIHVE